MNMRARWNYPTAIRFGDGRISELAKVCGETGMSRPLLVTDAGLAGLPMVGEVMAQLTKADLSPALFSDVKANPVWANIDAGIVAYRDGEHDGVIAMGGGSALDAGKLVAFMQGQELPVWEFEDIGTRWMRADSASIAPIIAIPTTAGTGSEVGRAAVVTNEETHIKKIIFHPMMMPSAVIADPALTVGLPAMLTAGTGMDALAHCLEAYCSTYYHPMSEGIAVEGMRLVKDNLLRAFKDGSDLDARGNMLSAAMMGAVAFQKGLGGIHSLSHPVGALYDTHHGMTNAVFMPYVLVHNREAIAAKLERLSLWLGLGDGGFDAFLDWVLGLREEIGVPHILEGLGVDDAQAGLIADMAIKDPTAAGNPLPLTLSGARSIFDNAVAGKLAR